MEGEQGLLEGLSLLALWEKMALESKSVSDFPWKLYLMGSVTMHSFLGLSSSGLVNRSGPISSVLFFFPEVSLWMDMGRRQ